MVPKIRMNTAVFSYSVILFYVLAVLVATGFFSFPISKDEVEFWPAALNYAVPFADYGKAVMQHNMIQNPLPFMIFGSFERFFGLGIAAARAVNFATSLMLLMLAARLVPPSNVTTRSPFIVFALLLNPYFVGTSVHMYTDIFAAFFSLAGVFAHRKKNYLWSFLAFFAAISCRQYMLAFPAGLALYHCINWLRGAEPEKKSWIVPGLACLTLFVWIFIFGGLIPPQVKQHGNLEILKGLGFWSVFPYQSLYFLTSVGVYFALPKALLETLLTTTPTETRPVSIISRLRNSCCFCTQIKSFKHPNIYVALVIVIMAGLFFLFPPIKNSGPSVTETMGFFDIAVRFVCGDFWKLFIFYALAVLAILSVPFLSFEFIAMIINASLLMKAHIAWDKYALPMVVVLWFLWCLEGKKSTAAQDCTR